MIYKTHILLSYFLQKKHYFYQKQIKRSITYHKIFILAQYLILKDEKKRILTFRLER